MLILLGSALRAEGKGSSHFPEALIVLGERGLEFLENFVQFG
jgi:hypothetical protein